MCSSLSLLSLTKASPYTLTMATVLYNALLLPARDQLVLLKLKNMVCLSLYSNNAAVRWEAQYWRINDTWLLREKRKSTFLWKQHWKLVFASSYRCPRPCAQPGRLSCQIQHYLHIRGQLNCWHYGSLFITSQNPLSFCWIPFNSVPFLHSCGTSHRIILMFSGGLKCSLKVSLNCKFSPCFLAWTPETTETWTLSKWVSLRRRVPLHRPK